jgi:hypothetical protein
VNGSGATSQRVRQECAIARQLPRPIDPLMMGAVRFGADPMGGQAGMMARSAVKGHRNALRATAQYEYEYTHPPRDSVAAFCGLFIGSRHVPNTALRRHLRTHRTPGVCDAMSSASLTSPQLRPAVAGGSRAVASRRAAAFPQRAKPPRRSPVTATAALARGVQCVSFQRGRVTTSLLLRAGTPRRQCRLSISAHGGDNHGKAPPRVIDSSHNITVLSQSTHPIHLQP